MVWILLGFGATPWDNTTWPRQMICCLAKMHLGDKIDSAKGMRKLPATDPNEKGMKGSKSECRWRRPWRISGETTEGGHSWWPEMSMEHCKARTTSLWTHSGRDAFKTQFYGCQPRAFEFDGNLDGGPVWRTKKCWTSGLNNLRRRVN